MEANIECPGAILTGAVYVKVPGSGEPMECLGARKSHSKRVDHAIGQRVKNKNQIKKECIDEGNRGEEGKIDRAHDDAIRFFVLPLEGQRRRSSPPPPRFQSQTWSSSWIRIK